MSETNPRRKPSGPRIEPLEGRTVMTAGAGSTFAIMSGEFTAPDQPVTIEFAMNRRTITPGERGAVIGIDVVDGGSGGSNGTDGDGGATNPTVKSVVAANGRVLAAPKLNGDAPPAYVSLVTIPAIKTGKPLKAKVEVVSGSQVAGEFFAGFFLPGDVYGDGSVDKNDLSAVKSMMGSTNGDQLYNFHADGNRNGLIDQHDLQLVQRNQGVRVNVYPVMTANLDPDSDTGEADRITGIKTVTFRGAATPGAKVKLGEATGRFESVTATANPRGIWTSRVTLADGSNAITLSARDPFGQTFTGELAPVTFDASQTPEEVVDPTPKPVKPQPKPAVNTPRARPAVTTNLRNSAVVD